MLKVSPLLLAAVLLAACASSPRPVTWRSVDGSYVNPDRLQTSFEMCRGEALSAGAQLGTNFEGLSAHAQQLQVQPMDFSGIERLGNTMRRNRQRDDLQTAIFRSCMARNGFIAI